MYWVYVCVFCTLSSVQSVNMYCPYVNCCFFCFVFCTVWSTLIRISLTKALVLWWCDNKSDLIWFEYSNEEVLLRYWPPLFFTALLSGAPVNRDRWIDPKVSILSIMMLYQKYQSSHKNIDYISLLRYIKLILKNASRFLHKYEAVIIISNVSWAANYIRFISEGLYEKEDLWKNMLKFHL